MSRKYKDKTLGGTTYWEDENGNREYERETFGGTKYREDSEGNRAYERETLTGRNYREDGNGNRTYEDEITNGETLSGREYEEKRNGFFSTAIVSKTRKDASSKSNRSNNGGGSSASTSGDTHWLFWIALLPAVAMYGMLQLAYEFFFKEQFENTKLARFLSAPVKTVDSHLGAAYLLVSLGCFIAFRADNNDWFMAVDIILALIHPVYILLILALAPLFALLAITDTANPPDGILGVALILIPMSLLPYYFVGIVMMPFFKDDA